jgi:nitroreductase
MQLDEAVATRRSVGRLCEPAPSDEEVLRILELALLAPDHGRLSPWRVIGLRGDARNALGERFADATAVADGVARERAAAKPLRAPLLLSLVFTPVPGHKVPEWEQLAAAVCAVHTVILLMHERHWGCMWRTGALLDDPGVRSLLELRPDEKLLGWLYVGTPVVDATTQPPRATRSLEAKYLSLK